MRDTDTILQNLHALLLHENYMDAKAFLEKEFQDRDEIHLQETALLRSQLATAISQRDRAMDFAKHYQSCAISYYDKNCTCGLTALIKEISQ